MGGRWTSVPCAGKGRIVGPPFREEQKHFLRNRTFSGVKDVTRKHRGDGRAEQRPGAGGAGGAPVGRGCSPRCPAPKEEPLVGHTERRACDAEARATRRRVRHGGACHCPRLPSSAQRGGCGHSPRRDAGSGDTVTTCRVTANCRQTLQTHLKSSRSLRVPGTDHANPANPAFSPDPGACTLSRGA